MKGIEMTELNSLDDFIRGLSKLRKKFMMSETQIYTTA